MMMPPPWWVLGVVAALLVYFVWLFVLWRRATYFDRPL